MHKEGLCETLDTSKKPAHKLSFCEFYAILLLAHFQNFKILYIYLSTFALQFTHSRFSCYFKNLGCTRPPPKGRVHSQSSDLLYGSRTLCKVGLKCTCPVQSSCSSPRRDSNSVVIGWHQGFVMVKKFLRGFSEA